jgi:hypothetical protein
MFLGPPLFLTSLGWGEISFFLMIVERTENLESVFFPHTLKKYFRKKNFFKIEKQKQWGSKFMGFAKLLVKNQF